MYTDETILTFGKHKFTKLCRVPTEYLLQCYRNRIPNKELMEYIENNFDKIKGRQEGKIITPGLEQLCEKITYASEKIAKLELRRIRSIEQLNKKPERTYECEKCGGWHLTSITHEQWEKVKNNRMNCNC